jgi:hypothetical protein
VARQTPKQDQPQDDDVLPSTTAQQWLWTERQHGTYPPDTERVGKWLLYFSPGSVDEWWAKVKQATEEGRLGSGAKVGRFYGQSYVVCVYTYDGHDKEDAMRVREGLRALGLTRRIAYKLDQDTLAGRYSATGDSVTLYLA